MRILIKLLALFVLILITVMLIKIIGRSSARRSVADNKKNAIQQILDKIPSRKQDTPTGNLNNTTTIDCATDSNCEELIFNGDSKYVFPNGAFSPFSGFADPSIRKDPVTGTLWLAYSWPHYKIENGNRSPSSEIHLSKSIDGGKTWNFVGPLFETTPMNNPDNPSQSGYLDYEVVNLLPVEMNGKTTWFAVTLNYFIPDQGGFSARPVNSFFISVYKSDNIEQLSNSPSANLGSNISATAWNLHQTLVPTDMNKLDTNSFFWNEPSLYYENGTLYLTMVAFNLRNRSDITRDGVYVFATDPTGAPRTWNWEYKGMLAGNTEAAELGAERLTQVDIAKGVDGQTLMITTPDDWNSRFQDYNHKGCVVLEVASMDNPTLKRDDNGNLVARARIIDSDANELGSAACSYDPNSATGIIMTRRNKTQTELTASIWETGVRP